MPASADLTQLNVRVPQVTHEALRRVAFERQLPMQDIVAAVIGDWLASEARAVVERWGSELRERAEGGPGGANHGDAL